MKTYNTKPTLNTPLKAQAIYELSLLPKQYIYNADGERFEINREPSLEAIIGQMRKIQFRNGGEQKPTNCRQLNKFSK